MAMEEAKKNLQQSLRDRIDVNAVTSVVFRELENNHISQRIGILLKETRR